MLSEIFDLVPSTLARWRGKSKYAFTGEVLTIRFGGRAGEQLWGIRSLIDIPMHNVKAGDLGGFIAGHSQLSHVNAAWVADNAMVGGGALVAGQGLLSDFSALESGICYGKMRNFSVVSAPSGGGVSGVIDRELMTIYPSGSGATALLTESKKEESVPGRYPVRIIDYTYPNNDKSYPERRNAIAEEHGAKAYFSKLPIYKV